MSIENVVGKDQAIIVEPIYPTKYSYIYGKNVKHDGGEVKGALYAAVLEEGQIDSCSLTITGEAKIDEAYAAYITKGSANGNTVELNGPLRVTTARAAYVENSKSRFEPIKPIGPIIYPNYELAKADENLASLSSANSKKVTMNVFYLGGLNDNKIILSGDSWVESVAAAETAIGSAYGNKTILKERSLANKAYGALVTGDEETNAAGSNQVQIIGSKNKKAVYMPLAKEVYGAYVVKGRANNNTVTVKGTALLEQVRGAYVKEAVYYEPPIHIYDPPIHVYEPYTYADDFQYVKANNIAVVYYGSGAAGNQVVVDGVGTSISNVAGVEVESGKANNNSVLVKKGFVTNAYGAIGGTDAKLSGNSIISKAKAELIAGALVNNGSAYFNTATVNGGSVAKAYAAIAEGEAKLEWNELTVKKGIVEEAYLVKQAGGSAKNNTMTIKGGTVKRAAIAELADGASAEDNILVISGGRVAELRGSGEGCANNTIEVRGGRVANYYASDKDNNYISGGRVTNLEVGTGAKLFVEGGKITNASLQEGEATLEISRGTIGTLSLDADHSVVNINGGKVKKIIGSDGQSTISVKGNSVQNINCGAGVDNITLLECKKLTCNAGAGDDSFTISGGTNLKIAGGEGADLYSFMELAKKGRYNLEITDGEDRIDLSSFNSGDFIRKENLKQDKLTLVHMETRAEISIKGYYTNSVYLSFADTAVGVDAAQAAEVETPKLIVSGND